MTDHDALTIAGAAHELRCGRLRSTDLVEQAFRQADAVVQAQRVRRRAQRELAGLFAEVDFVIGPTTAFPATRLSELDVERSMSAALATSFTTYWSAVGNPALAVPIGFNRDGLPLSMQIAGRPFDDAARATRLRPPGRTPTDEPGTQGRRPERMRTVRRFDNAVAVVTGGASGIGRALVRDLAVGGARVLVLDINDERLALVAREEPGCLTMHVDVTEREALDRAAARAEQELGPVTIVCANAGVSGPTGARLWELTPAQWDQALGPNLMGVINTMSAFLPQVLRAGGGRVLITASMAALTTWHIDPAYFASKHAVLSVAETLRAQVRRDQLPLTVSVALPSLVDTNIGESHDEEFEAWQDLSRPRMQAADVARLMLEGMAAGQFYIFTHAGSLARIDRRYREVNAACQQSTAVN
jgi:NAD(P)-dependent dehydrogenase (short-subunit alcohol dehydrogenase family)